MSPEASVAVGPEPVVPPVDLELVVVDSDLASAEVVLVVSLVPLVAVLG